jgi:hypothetical protein
LAGGVGGTNTFGNDGIYEPASWPAEMAPLSGGDWDASSNAGGWYLYLNGARPTSSVNIGFRSALYL